MIALCHSKYFVSLPLPFRTQSWPGAGITLVHAPEVPLLISFPIIVSDQDPDIAGGHPLMILATMPLGLEKRRRNPTSLWAKHRNQIERLYCDELKPLHEIVVLLQDKHGL